MRRRFVGDIETNGFLQNMFDEAKFHCIVLGDLDTGEYLRFNDQPEELLTKPKHGTIDDAIRLMNEADELYFHYGHGFDYLAMKYFHPEFNPKITALFDTVTMAQAVYRNIRGMDFGAMAKGKRHPDFAKMQLVGKHSLKAWGYRLGVLKSSIADADGVTDWSKWTPEMEDYCEQDVRVTWKLLDLLLSEKNLKKHPMECHKLDNRFQHIMSRQERHGFFFDELKAVDLYGSLEQQRRDIEDELRTIFTPWYQRGKLFTPKRDNRPQGYVAGAPFTKIVHTEFKPSSRDHIQNRLQALYGWKPKAYGADGKATVDESVLSGLSYPPVRKLMEYLVINKTIGALSTGKKAWLKFVKSGRIHGRIDPMGTVTWRCSHSNPNLGQVPSVDVDDAGHPIWGLKGKYGPDCRELFTVPDGSSLCGADASGLELRCLGHYMAKHDDGDYAKVVVEGDVHSVNQKAIGLYKRSNAKTWIYAFLYGAGDVTLGSTVLADMPEETRERFIKWARKPDHDSEWGKKRKPMSKEQALAFLGNRSRLKVAKGLPALGKLIDQVKKKAKKQGWLRGLDGRLLECRAVHSALNTVLQSAGAIIMKRWLVILDEELQKAGFVPHQWKYMGEEILSHYEFVANVHDEAQTEVINNFAAAYNTMAEDCFPLAGDYYGFRAPITGEGKVGSCWTETH